MQKPIFLCIYLHSSALTYIHLHLPTLILSMVLHMTRLTISALCGHTKLTISDKVDYKLTIRLTISALCGHTKFLTSSMWELP